GVGVSVVNALSERLQLTIWRQRPGDHHRHRGGAPQGGLIVTRTPERAATQGDWNATGTTKRRGTKVTFKPDTQIFETTEFSFDTLAQRLRELAFLNGGGPITLRHEGGGQSPHVL